MTFFNRLSIGKKISMGFIIIILITIISSVYSLFNTLNVNRQVNVLSEQYMVEVEDLNEFTKVMNELNISSQLYFTDGKDLDYNSAMEAIIKANEQLKGLDNLVVKYPNLIQLKSSLDTITSKMNEYSKSIEAIKELQKLKAEKLDTMSSIGITINQVVSDLTASQNGKLNIAFDQEKTDIDTIKQRYKKVEKINKINVDFAAIRLRNTQIITQLADITYADAMDTMNPLLDTLIIDVEQLKSLFTDPTDIGNMDKALGVLDDYKIASKALYEELVQVDTVSEQAKGLANDIMLSIDSINESAIGQTVEIVNKSQSSLTTAMYITLASLVIMILLAIMIAFITIRNITKTMNAITGNLSDASYYIASASNQLANASDQLASGSTEQASSIEEISATMEETSSMVMQNTENTRQAAGLSKQSSISSRQGVEQMLKMQVSMQEIKNSSSQISKVIRVIDDIAFQTNILALNAAVEAARAGDAGKGFAVVAEEVRNLAQRSAEAAKDTAAMIETNIKLSDEGVIVSNQVNTSLGEINTNIENMNKLVNEITAASEEQSRGVKQVTEAIAQMEDVVQQTAATAEESASAAEELNNQAETLKNAVDELVVLVHGAKGNEHTTQKNPSVYKEHTTSKAKGNKNISPVTSKKTYETWVPKNRSVSPSEVLPLDNDDDF
jgi:methyl-accepting chemotaxis protein